MKDKNIQVFSLKETQTALNNLLVKLSIFLDKHQLKYFLFGGTALGAIRHKGFIPWDDDIDLAMPRSEYERFLKIIETDNGDFDVYEIRRSKNYFFPFVKVADKEIRSYCPSWRWQIGVNIDVFPLDYVPLDKEQVTDICNRISKTRMAGYAVMSSLKGVKTQLKKRHKSYLLPFIIFLRVFATRSFQKYIKKRYDKIFFSLKSENDRLLNVAYAKTENRAVRKEVYQGSIDVEFEGKKYPVMKGYDEFLTAYYGDYKIIPNENERINHSVIVYKNTINSKSSL